MSNRAKRKFPRLRVIVVMLILLGVMYLWLRENKEEEATVREIKAPVTVIKPLYGEMVQTFKISGYIESESMVTILPKISGTLVSLDVEVGDRIKKGDQIAGIDDAPYTLQLEQAKAAYLAVKSTWERISQLYAANAASKQSYEETKAQYDAAKAQYELALLQASYTRITSPIDGTVLVVHTSVGSLVAPQIPIVTIGDMRNLVIKAKIPENYYHFFLRRKDTMEVTASLPALGNEAIAATIERVSPYIPPQTKNFEVLCKLTGDTSMVRPGMFIYLTFIMDKREGIYSLPYSTLVAGNTLWYVDPETGRARRMDFEPSYRSDTRFQIGDEFRDYLFISEGQHFLKEGQEVRILNDDVVPASQPGGSELPAGGQTQRGNGEPGGGAGT